MSSLTSVEKRQLEKATSFEPGYVLNFSDRTFGDFFADTAGIDIHSSRYTAHGTSKAKKLRAFWDLDQDAIVGKVMAEMLRYLKENYPPDRVDPDLLLRCEATITRLNTGGPDLSALKEVAKVVNSAYIAAQVKRAQEAVSSDPPLAIGTAKELVETVCTTILQERGKPIPDKPDVEVLAALTMKELDLSPSGKGDGGQGAKTTQRLLGNLAGITKHLAELRNLTGTGHGKAGSTPQVEARHAALAVASASAFCSFLFETHKAQPPQASRATA